ncbi:Crp/Fnr family transcriptional regulator [Bacillus sp. AGMB 02131]|uniref:Crp/Fnr family transcriptional regulator n=1 Tax=Peribacillus faecalis TaxID=2772559 RepID=A0A927HAK0_9BACI|nr:Crp/Fnr family transcriptional regulator [Peribacillus faecalis]MBD3108009.1 Crp/Fnr family transcriptional regulator [Peribacillus faecalis]
MNQYSIKDLKKFDLFSDLSNDQLQLFKSTVYWRTYKKGQFLFIEDDPRERIYFLLKGFVKLTRTNQSGKMTYCDYVKSFTTFPCGGLFTDSTYHFSAEAVTDLELFYLPTKVFEEHIKKNRSQLIKIVTSLSDILKTHENRVQQLANAQQRVIQTLTYLMSDLGVYGSKDEIIIECPITTTEIAYLSGTSRETVSQVLKQLKEEDILSCKNKIWTIHKPETIDELAG